MIMAWLPACGTTGRWWDLQEVGCLGVYEDLGSRLLLCLSLLPTCQEVSSFAPSHAPHHDACLATGPETAAKQLWAATAEMSQTQFFLISCFPQVFWSQL
jgi:hypothetical protein